MSVDKQQIEREVNELVGKILPLLIGQRRNVQWGALAEVVAIWLQSHAGVDPKLLEPLLRVHVDMVRKFVVAADKAERLNG